MVKKLIFIALLSACIGGIIYSYLTLEKKTHLNTPVINCVPKDAALLIHIKKPLSLWASVSETSLIWNNLKEVEFVEKLDITLKEIDSTIQQLGFQKEKEVILSIHKGSEVPSYLIAFSTDAIENSIINKELKTTQHSLHEGVSILKNQSDNNVYSCYISPFTLISSNENTLHNSINQLLNKTHLLQDSTFNSLYQKTNTNNNLQLYYNASNLKTLTVPYLNKDAIESWPTNGEWSSLDIILENNQLLLNGLKALSINHKKASAPTKRIDINLLPRDLNSIIEHSFNKNQIPLKIVNSVNSECNCNSLAETKNWIGDHLTEITYGNKNTEKAYFLAINESPHLIEQIKELIKVDSVVIKSNDASIYKIEHSSLNLLFNIKSKDLYFTVQNSQLVISSLAGLKRLSFEWKKNKHTKPTFNYSIFSEEHLAQKANFNWFTTSDYLAQNITSALKNEYKSTPLAIVKQLEHNFQIGYQTNRLNNNLEHTALIIKTETGSTSNSNELWELTLGTPISSSLQLLNNHKSKSLDLFIQDSTNTIHLINAAGRIKWSKKLEGKLIDKVQQVDVYGNNKFQMLFNTNSHIHIIDINGNYVKGFPVKLDNKATSSVSIFDYDKTNNYRFWISCENKITYNYDEEGKKVTGWNLPKSQAIIKNQYKRAVFNQKDYIYNIDTKGNVYFLNRRGEVIYNLDKPLLARGNKITFQKRASLTSSSFIFQDDSTNKLIDYTLGNVSQEIILDKNHPKITYKIMDLDKNSFIDYLAIFQNKIEIYGMDKTIISKNEFISNVSENNELIESHNNKHYIAIKGEDSDDIILLDSHLKQINNELMTGSLNLSIGDINSDGKLDIVTIINKETIKVYSLN